MIENNYKKRIAKNSIILYIRMLITLSVSLYTSRVVLNALGIENFGLFNVVAGVVVLFSFINMSLSTASSRFINYELGKNNFEFQNLGIVFSSCLCVHLLLALLIAFLCETIGLYLLYTQIQIADSRFDAALCVYHLSVASICIGIIFAPFNAEVIAHERIDAFTYISITEVVGKLLIAFLLPIIYSDKLIVYAYLLLAMTALVQGIYVLYCYKKFDECRRLRHPDRLLLKKIFTFTGWNLLGDAAYTSFSQGLNLLLNIFFGAAINAARGIAVQVNGIVLRLIQSFQTAVNPQIVQSYSSGDGNKMHDLIIMASRYTFYLMTVLAIPILFNIEFLLSIWLVDVPNYTGIFIQIMILISYFDALGYSMTVAINATGKNRNYQLIVSGTMLFILPLSYLCLKFGYPPHAVFLCHLFIGFVAHILRLLCVHKEIGLHILPYVKCIFIKGGIVVLLSSLGTHIVKQVVYDDNSWLTLIVSFLLTCSWVFLIGLNKRERAFLLNKLKR